MISLIKYEGNWSENNDWKKIKDSGRRFVYCQILQIALIKSINRSTQQEIFTPNTWRYQRNYELLWKQANKRSETCKSAAYKWFGRETYFNFASTCCIIVQVVASQNNEHPCSLNSSILARSSSGVILRSSFIRGMFQPFMKPWNLSIKADSWNT